MVLYAFPQLQLTNELTALAASFIPYGSVAWAAATLIFGFAAKRWMKSLALVTVVWSDDAGGLGDGPIGRGRRPQPEGTSR